MDEAGLSRRLGWFAAGAVAASFAHVLLAPDGCGGQPAAAGARLAVPAPRRRRRVPRCEVERTAVVTGEAGGPTLRIRWRPDWLRRPGAAGDGAVGRLAAVCAAAMREPPLSDDSGCVAATV
jgi:hypothetical protein